MEQGPKATSSLHGGSPWPLSSARKSTKRTGDCFNSTATRTGFEPAPSTLTRWCSTVELSSLRCPGGSRTLNIRILNPAPLPFGHGASRLARKEQGSNLRRCYPGYGLATRPIASLAPFLVGLPLSPSGPRIPIWRTLVVQAAKRRAEVPTPNPCGSNRFRDGSGPRPVHSPRFNYGGAQDMLPGEQPSSLPSLTWSGLTPPFEPLEATVCTAVGTAGLEPATSRVSTECSSS